MAGIGFVLRRLTQQNNLSGVIQAYFHSALASAGPWLFTIIAIALVVSLSSNYIGNQSLYDFRLIIIYNFSFSLVISGPIFMVATRYLADSIYREDVSYTPGLLIGTLVLQYMIQAPIGIWFYFFFTKFTFVEALSNFVNFMLIGAIWLLAIFLTALKDYKTVTWSFLIGLTGCIILCPYVARYFGSTGMINAFSLGLSFIVIGLLTRIFVEYRYRIKAPFDFLPFMKHYWELTLAGLFYNMGIWVDKWIMWFAPEREMTESGLINYPYYDSAMFLAYITIVPSLAMFVISIETEFFEHYLRFYREIQQKVNFKKILVNQRSIINSIMQSCGKFLVLQGSLSAIVIMLAPKLFSLFGISSLEIGIFRYGVLGALFHAMFLFLSIILSYFDNRKAVCYIYFTFLFFNATLTYAFMDLGFSYYGYGYFMASLISFVIAAFITARYVNDLPYHAFITSNNSVTITNYKS